MVPKAPFAIFYVIIGGVTALSGTPFVPIRPSTFVPAAKTPNKSSYGVMLIIGRMYYISCTMYYISCTMNYISCTMNYISCTISHN